MITAIVLAAGLSTRMGAQKMTLPWGRSTVIGAVIQTMTDAGIEDICVITGELQAELRTLLKGYKVNLINNKNYQNGEMLTSIQVGLRELKADTDAVLIILGDQPQIEAKVVKIIMERYRSTHHQLIVPSYIMHRGHPCLVGKEYWEEILALTSPCTLRDFLNMHAEKIDYVMVDTPSIVQDLDTQQDYERYNPHG
jgi:molybdenum cofactor cytidylyltransferase